MKPHPSPRLKKSVIWPSVLPELPSLDASLLEQFFLRGGPQRPMLPVYIVDLLHIGCQVVIRMVLVLPSCCMTSPSNSETLNLTGLLGLHRKDCSWRGQVIPVTEWPRSCLERFHWSDSARDLDSPMHEEWLFLLEFHQLNCLKISRWSSCSKKLFLQWNHSWVVALSEM